MFLNDAVDAPFDRVYRRERPIPSGQIGRTTVSMIAAILLTLGWICCIPLGRPALFCATVLLALIITYDLLHKRISSSPLIMAGCRVMLYLTAGSAATPNGITPAIFPGIGLGIYVTGVSVLARGESQAEHKPHFLTPMLLVLFPLGLVILVRNQFSLELLIPFCITLAWLAFSFVQGLLIQPPQLGRAVSSLLAGIVLLDWMAAPSLLQCQAFIFLSLFGLALLLQRTIPAT
jgi:4-hydroxybenzoate polyprenyltransferase